MPADAHPETNKHQALGAREPDGPADKPHGGETSRKGFTVSLLALPREHRKPNSAEQPHWVKQASPIGPSARAARGASGWDYDRSPEGLMLTHL